MRERRGHFYVRRVRLQADGRGPAKAGRYRSLCLYAYAVAAARDDRSSFVKMLLTWRATVFSLMRSRPAIVRFFAPVATRRSTSISRPVSPVPAPGEG